MPRLFPLGAAGIAIAFTAWGQTATGGGAATLGVFMEFDAAPGTSSLAIMQHEVASVLKPSGIEVNWKLARENHGDQRYARLVVLKFNGTCRTGGWEAQTAESPAEALSLGETKVLDGRVLPYTEVRCDEVRKALMYLAPAASEQQRQVALGMALARVVAHELYHVLAGTTVHALRGLAKASQPLPELISTRNMGFEERDAAAMRKGFPDPLE